MRWFCGSRAFRFPRDMPARLDLLGRYGMDPTGCGIEAGEIWAPIVAPLLEPARTGPDGFLARLAAVPVEPGSFATYGRAYLVWELFSGEALTRPAAWPLIDAGIDFKLGHGLNRLHLTGYEAQRLDRRPREREF